MARGKKLWIKDYLFLVMWFFKFMFYFSVLIDDECSSDLTKKAKYAFEALAISCIQNIRSEKYSFYFYFQAVKNVTI